MEKINDEVKSQARYLSGIANSSINNQMSFAEHALHLVTMVEENEDLDEDLKVMFVECMALLCKAIKNSISGTCVVEVKYEGEITSNQGASDAVNTLESAKRRKAIYNSIMRVLMSDAGKMLQSATNSELDELALKRATTDYAQIDDEITQLKRELSQCREIRKGFKQSKGGVTPRGINTPRGGGSTQESVYKGWIVIDDEIMPILRNKSLKISRHIAQLNTRNKSLNKGIESTKRDIERYIAKFTELAESPSHSKLFRLTKRKILLSVSPNSTTLLTSSFSGPDMVETEFDTELAAELNNMNDCKDIADSKVKAEDCAIDLESTTDSNNTKDISEEKAEGQKEDLIEVSDKDEPEITGVESVESNATDASIINEACVTKGVTETGAVQEIAEEAQSEHSVRKEEIVVLETQEPIPEVTTATIDYESNEVESEPFGEESPVEPLEDISVPDIELPLRTETSGVESADSSVDEERELEEPHVPSDGIELEPAKTAIDEAKQDISEEPIIVEEEPLSTRDEDPEIIADDNIEEEEIELANTTICCTGEAPTTSKVAVPATSEYELSDGSIYVDDSSKPTGNSPLSSVGSVYGDSPQEAAADDGQDPATLTGLFRRLDAFDFFNVPTDLGNLGNSVENMHGRFSTLPSTQVTDTGSTTCVNAMNINALDAKECLTPVMTERIMLDKATTTNAILEETREQQKKVAAEQEPNQSELLNNETRLFDAAKIKNVCKEGVETRTGRRSKSTSSTSVDHTISRCNSGEFACNIVYKLRPSRPDEFTNEVRIYYTPQDELPTIFLPLLSSSSVVKQPGLIPTSGVADRGSSCFRNKNTSGLGSDKYGRTHRARHADNKEGGVWGIFNNCWSWITNGY